jgi:O-antigen ligase
LSDFLAGLGVVLAAGASAASILLPAGRPRAAAMLLALVLFPVLILGDQWHTDQIVDLRNDAGRIVFLIALAVSIVAALAYVFRRWPVLLPLAIVFTLPFRIPLHAGGDSANLLVPLYLVIAGGVVATLLRDWRNAAPAGGAGGKAENGAAAAPAGLPPRDRPRRPALWLPRILAAVVVLYALQSLYSDDFSKALQNVCFFLVPFTVAYGLLAEVKWSRELLTVVLCLVAVEAVAFVFIGSIEYLSKSLFWNDAVIRSNEFHTYFRVNSIFWDPNVYGRYLALVLVVVTTAMLWAKDRRDFWLLAGTILVLWIGLVETFSQSSYIALASGLAVLAAVRWSWRWTLAAVVAGLIGAILVVTLVGGKGVSFNRINVDTSGRANLVQGGTDLFGERPLQGYGSGSFQVAYAEHRTEKNLPVTVSHTEPVTVAAEQGAIGLLAYLALIAVALLTMLSGLRAPPAGGAGEEGEEAEDGAAAPPAGLPSRDRTRRPELVGRIAVLATFVALLVHTMAYAGFFEDPITWVLLALGASLATLPAVREPAPAVARQAA